MNKNMFYNIVLLHDLVKMLTFAPQKNEPREVSLYNNHSQQAPHWRKNCPPLRALSPPSGVGRLSLNL